LRHLVHVPREKADFFIPKKETLQKGTGGRIPDPPVDPGGRRGGGKKPLHEGRSEQKGFQMTGGNVGDFVNLALMERKGRRGG